MSKVLEEKYEEGFRWVVRKQLALKTFLGRVRESFTNNAPAFSLYANCLSRAEGRRMVIVEVTDAGRP